MNNLTSHFFLSKTFLFLIQIFLVNLSLTAQITEIIDPDGDGTGNTLNGSHGVGTDGSNNIYIAGAFSDNVFKITPSGTITEIIDATGDGAGNTLDGPKGVAVDDSGNVYVANSNSDNVFKITPSGTITEIIDGTGDGTNTLDGARAIAVDGSGNVYVAGSSTDNVFKITSGGTITQIIDATGDGTNILNYTQGINVDNTGNVYVGGGTSDNVFKVTPGGTITQIIDATGDGTNTLDNPRTITTGSDGSLFIAGWNSDNVFKISSGGTITEIIDGTGDGMGNLLDSPRGMAIDGTGHLFVASYSDDNAFKVAFAVLPVELISFEAKLLNRDVILTWKTASEINNEKFELQASQDGIEFKTIGEVKGRGTTDKMQHYAFVDKNAQEGLNYYRLKQVDYDEKYEYSNIVTIEARTSAIDISNIYPNPTSSGLFNLEYSSTKNKNLEVTVLDMSGKVVLSRIENIISGMNQMSFDLSSFQNNIYFIEINDGLTSVHKKIVIQK